METLKPIGFFSAHTFDGVKYDFVLADDGLIYTSFLDKPVRYMLFKPNMQLIMEDRTSFSFDELSRKTKEQRHLIKTYDISPELFETVMLYGRGNISTEMAMFYGLNPEWGYDRRFKPNPFKRVKEEKRFVKQRLGKFK